MGFKVKSLWANENIRKRQEVVVIEGCARNEVYAKYPTKKQIRKRKRSFCGCEGCRGKFKG